MVMKCAHNYARTALLTNQTAFRISDGKNWMNKTGSRWLKKLAVNHGVTQESEAKTAYAVDNEIEMMSEIWKSKPQIQWRIAACASDVHWFVCVFFVLLLLLQLSGSGLCTQIKMNYSVYGFQFSAKLVTRASILFGWWSGSCNDCV